MPSRRKFFLASTALLLAASRAHAKSNYSIEHSEEQWHSLLTPDQYYVMRKAGTERPWTSSLLNEHREGRFVCAGCSSALFNSSAKFNSGTGWPSFFQALPDSTQEISDRTFGMTRTEVRCATCGSHLGHVFDDGPKPTGLRYCMNGIALKFQSA